MKVMFSGPLTLLLFIMRSGLTSVVQRHYEYNQLYYSWYGAQSVCTRDSGNLATVYTQIDVNNMYLKEHYVWISMTKTYNSWYWISPEGQQTYINNWADWHWHGQNGDGPCAAANYLDKKIFSVNCDFYYFFICGNNGTDGNKYTFIPETKTWSDAQDYCKKNYGFLAIYRSSDLSNNIQEEDFPVWVGLHREGGSWSWTTGFSGYVNWSLNEPSGNGDCVSISSVTKRMATQNCEARFPFVCIWENVFLVKEEKSWAEALTHCRGLTSSNLRFDLLSVEPGDEHEYVWKKVMEADTEEVWTGLRFLANEWLWVNGAQMLYPEMPLCPSSAHHCGAFAKDTGRMEARDCSERNNFLCYSY